eukprot:Rhum_TRINITY_DN14174_c1_g3::Rhum_TRINITY_DN14174_c1_g3_i1::g.70668::m.70668/K10380/ANK; ankyrin
MALLDGRSLFFLLFIYLSLPIFVCAAERVLWFSYGANAPMFGLGLWVVYGLGAGLTYWVCSPPASARTPVLHAVRLSRPEGLSDRSHGTVRFTLQGGSARHGEAQRCMATWWDRAGGSLVLNETRSGRVALIIPWNTVSRHFLKLTTKGSTKEPVRVLLLCQPVLPKGETKEVAPVIVKLHLTHCHDIDSLRQCFRGCPPQTRELSPWMGHDIPMKSGYHRYCSPARLSDCSHLLSQLLSVLAPFAAVSKFLRGVGGTGVVTALYGFLETLPLCYYFAVVIGFGMTLVTLLQQYREGTLFTLFTVYVAAVPCIFGQEPPSPSTSPRWIFHVASIAVIWVRLFRFHWGFARCSFIVFCIIAAARKILEFLLLVSAGWMTLTDDFYELGVAESCILLSGPIGSCLFQNLPAWAEKLARLLEYITQCHPMRPNIVKKLSVVVRAYQYHEKDRTRYVCGYVCRRVCGYGCRHLGGHVCGDVCKSCYAEDVRPQREATIEDDDYLEGLKDLMQTAGVKGSDLMYTADILLSYLEALNFNAWGDVLLSACRCRCHYVLNVVLRRQASRWDVEAAIHVAAQEGHADILTTLHQHLKEYHPHSLPVRGEDGRTVLHTAADNGRMRVVTRVLDDKDGLFCVEATDRTTNGLTALHSATLAGKDGVAQELVDRYPKQAWGCTSDGRTVLHCAAAGGAVGLIERIAKEGSEPTPLTEDGRTPLHCAAECWQRAAVEALWNTFPDKDKHTQLEAKTQRGWTPLHLACRTRAKEVADQESVVLFLLDSDWDSGVSLNARTGLDTKGHGDTAVDLVLDSGNTTLLSFLQSFQNFRGAPLPVEKSSDGRTVLHRVRSLACLRVFNCILDDTALTTDGRTVLHCAAQSGACNVYAELREALARRDVTVPERTHDGLTCLHYAAQGGHVLMVSHLVTHYTKAADHQAQAKLSGNTPLHLAVLEGHGPVISKLLATDAGKTALTSRNCEGETPLHLAARRGWVVIAKALLRARGADVNARNKVGNTPLHLASCDLMAKLLIENNADVHAVGKSERLPLNMAARRGDLAVVTVLLHEMKKAQARGYSAPIAQPPLHDAAEGGHLEVVEALCKWDRSMVWQTDRYGNTVLHAAAETGVREIVETLCAADEASARREGVKPGDIARACNHRQQTPLRLAVEARHVETVKFLATKYPEVWKSWDTSRGIFNGCPTPLHSAVASGSLELVRFLTTKHCSQVFNCGDGNSRTPLHEAASSNRGGSLAMVKVLVTNCPEMCNVQDNMGKTPLHEAVSFDKRARIQFLITKCPDLCKLQDDHCRTPLHEAARRGTRKTVKFIVTNCPEMCIVQDDTGKTPLHEAAHFGNLAMTRLLVTKCPKMREVQDKQGRTPLYYAVLSGKVKTVQFLAIRCPEMRTARDHEGKTPLDHAVKWDRPVTTQFLKKFLKKRRRVQGKKDKTPLHDAEGSGSLETGEVLATRRPEMCTARVNEAGCGAGS